MNRLTYFGCVLLIAIVIGCGGTAGDTSTVGGSYGGYSNGYNSPGSTPIGSNGAASGNSYSSLPPNRIFYSVVNATSGYTEIWSTDSEGKNKAQFSSLPFNVATGEGFLAFVPHPTMQNAFFFAYQPKADAAIGIYKNSMVSMTNAVQVVPPAYTSLNQLALSPDGTMLAYTAVVGDGQRKLYRVPSSGATQPVALDVADQIAVSPTGDFVVYTKMSPKLGDLYVRSLVKDGEATQLTKTPEIDESYPAFRRDGQRIAYVRNSELYTLRVKDGLDVKQVTKTEGIGESGPSYSNDGGKIAFAGYSETDATKTGVYVVGAGGGTPKQVISDFTVGFDVFWVPAGGSSQVNTSLGFRMDLKPRNKRK